MWYELLDNNVFITKLYDQVPDLIDIRIDQINVLDECDKVSIFFDLQKYADNPPQKWNQSKYNTVVVNIDLFGIHEINMSYKPTNVDKSNIRICIDENSYIKVKITGQFNATIRAVVGMIQTICGY
ncbi:MAG: Imm50 family immunity protein [Terrisporobacter othiniensis]|uniref:Imm50 family immunity protein n=1 Tax=Terrisporobacter petrolearius TaxID=1460447 RepID=UPI0022DF2A09|nr:Imm50 family immunity protein [Terrisporobacter petrolearius]MDU4861607.1 Imm50 family immunity protein [Terrisporobacter othiniensis]MDU6995474.1 Imm50 family immunity protein [Terrisporobacter othiniensis]